jgi:hypothetical protein
MKQIEKRLTIIGFALFILFIISNQIVCSDNPSEPSEFTIQVSNNSPHVGDTVTVTLYEIPYGPYYPEAYVWFGGDVYYGYKAGEQPNVPDYVDFIVKDWSVKGIPADNEKFQATFSFIPEKEGVITIDVYAHRQYDVTFRNMQINAYGSSINSPDSNDIPNINDINGNGDLYSGAGGSMNSIIPVLLGIIILIVIVVIVIFLITRKKKVAPIKSISIEKQNNNISGIQMEIRDKPSVRMQITETKKQEKKSTNFCPDCGTKIEGTPKFCPECGVKL